MNVQTIIDFENIYVNYGMTTVLENINLKISSNENWAVLGANGSGKSTLMKLFSHDLYPNTKYEFKKEIFGRDRWDIFELKNHLGIITNDLHNRFLDYGKSAKAFDVILSGFYSSLGVFNHHSFSKEQLAEAEKVMEFLDISHIKDKKISETSTGEQKRCIIGRSLIHKPKAFILDEPTTGLDIKAQCNFIQILQKIAKNTPLILVTHNIEEIFPEITHIALMYNKTIYKLGRKEEILTSEHLSEIFETEIKLISEKNRYYLKNYS